MTHPVALLVRPAAPSGPRASSDCPDDPAGSFADLVADEDRATPDDDGPATDSPAVTAWPWLAVQPSLVQGLATDVTDRAATADAMSLAATGLTGQGAPRTGDAGPGPDTGLAWAEPEEPDTGVQGADGPAERPALSTSDRATPGDATPDPGHPEPDLRRPGREAPVPARAATSQAPDAAVIGAPAAGSDRPDDRPTDESGPGAADGTTPVDRTSEPANANRAPTGTESAAAVAAAGTRAGWGGADPGPHRAPDQTAPDLTGRSARDTASAPSTDAPAGPLDGSGPVAVTLRAAPGEAALIRLATADGSLADLLRAHLPELGTELRDMGLQAMALDVADLMGDPGDSGSDRDHGTDGSTEGGPGRGSDRSSDRDPADSRMARSAPGGRADGASPHPPAHPPTRPTVVPAPWSAPVGTGAPLHPSTRIRPDSRVDLRL